MPKSISSLVPSIEGRLAAWQAIQERLLQAPERRVRPTITLSRQYGCEAFPLAQRLVERLGQATGEAWSLFDKALIEKVAREGGVSLRLLQNLGDASQGLEALGLMPVGHQTHDAAFEKVAKQVVEIARVGQAVIVGRGGAILCRAMPNCFHFRLQADLEFRIASLARRLDLPREEAERMVRENSRLRERFISDCLGADVGDPGHYDAVFNNARHGLQDIAEAILAYVRSGWPEKGYFRA